MDRIKVSPTAAGITHPGLADALANGVFELTLKSLADPHLGRWADVLIPMPIALAEEGKILKRGDELEVSSPVYGIEPERCRVIARTTIAGPEGAELVLLVDASGPTIRALRPTEPGVP